MHFISIEPKKLSNVGHTRKKNADLGTGKNKWARRITSWAQAPNIVQLLRNKKTRKRQLSLSRFLSRQKELTLLLHNALTENHCNGMFNHRSFKGNRGVPWWITFCFWFRSKNLYLNYEGNMYLFCPLYIKVQNIPWNKNSQVIELWNKATKLQPKLIWFKSILKKLKRKKKGLVHF